MAVRHHAPKTYLEEALQPGIIDDILSGILIIWKACGKSNAELPSWSGVQDQNIPCLMNYMKVIETSNESVSNPSDTCSETDPAVMDISSGPDPAVFHKDWNHIADILLHQYEQYLVLLLRMEHSHGLDVTNFFPIVMYPDLIGITRISQKERDLLRESLLHGSFLKPKSHHFFYRNNCLLKIPLTFSACMEAYVKGEDGMCPDWSMETVPYDIFYNLDDFMVDIRFFRQPSSSNLCGVFAINNVTQSDLVISKSTPFSRKKTPPPLCLTSFASELLKNNGSPEIPDNESDSEGTANPLHDHTKGTSFVFLEPVLIKLGFAVGTKHIDCYSSPEKFVPGLSGMRVTDGWILQYYNSVSSDGAPQSVIAHIVVLRRLSSSHVLLLDSEDPAPRVFNHKSCYEYFLSTGADSMSSLLVKDLSALSWCSHVNKPVALGMVRCFVSNEYLTSEEFSLRVPFSGKQDSKLSELPTTTTTVTEIHQTTTTIFTEPRHTELNTTSNKDITPEAVFNSTPDEGSASSKEKSDDEDNDSSVPIITSQTLKDARKRTRMATDFYTATFPQSPKKKRFSSSKTKLNPKVPSAGDLFGSSSSEESSDEVEEDGTVGLAHSSPDVQSPLADSRPILSFINSLNSCVDALPPTLVSVKAIVDKANYLWLGESDELSMFIEVHCDALPETDLEDIENMENKIGYLSHVPFVHLIFKNISRIPLEDNVANFVGHRILNILCYNPKDDNPSQHGCCMTYESFEMYLMDRDPGSTATKMALINQQLTKKGKPVYDTSPPNPTFYDSDIDWRVDKDTEHFIRFNIHDFILYSPDENSDETMRSLQVGSLMANSPSFLRKTLPHQKFCLSKEVCSSELIVSFPANIDMVAG